MKKSVDYEHVIFDEATIRRGMATLRAAVEDGSDQTVMDQYGLMTVRRRGVIWNYDTIDELLADLVVSAPEADFIYAGFEVYFFRKGQFNERATLSVGQYRQQVGIEVSHSSRAVIERVHEVFRSAAPSFHRPPPAEPNPAPPNPRVFIGHGGKSTAWRDLKDHLADKHHFDVVAYETGARAGHTIRDILEEMLTAANFAVLVMTAEDEQSDGAVRARQNVVHEAGLFQGKLGFARAIIVIEDGVENLSNLDGVQYLKFKHTIAETFGEVLATIKREFGG